MSDFILTVTPGYQFPLDGSVKVEYSLLNALAAPTVNLEGSLGTLSITDDSVTTAKLADAALSADTTGRAKMEDGYVTKAKLEAAMQLPSGLVAAFAMSTPPTGWLECDGSAVSRTTYADLFTAIGTTFGVGNGTTTFNLPDLRGEFVRGWANARAVDTGRVFGSTQTSLYLNHSHPVASGMANYLYKKSAGDYVLDTTATGGAGWALGSATGDSTSGGTETRPRNVALMYCIKT